MSALGWVALVTMREHRKPAVREQAWAEDRLLLAALRARGIDARHHMWADPAASLEGASLVVLRTPWDYTWDLDAFLTWVDRAAKVAPVWNPPNVVRWNAHKSYLFELERRGVALPRTQRVPRGGHADVDALLREHGELVIKAAVDAGAMRAMRVGGAAGPRGSGASAGQAHLDALLRDGDALVQPFLRRITTEGERSLVYFGGRFSHALVKLPAPGEYRIQAAYGGTARAISPSTADLALAEAALAACPGETLHARVDVVTDNDGRSVLMELEAIEPYFFLETTTAGAERYAEAVAAKLG